MNPINKILQKKGLDGQAAAQPGQTGGQKQKFNFNNNQSQPFRELDPAIQQKLEYYNSPAFVRATGSVLPENFQLLQSSAVPCSAIIQPLLNTTLPVVNDPDPFRCTNCHCFCNPHWIFMNRGKYARCNLCGTSNPVPERHYCELDEDGYPTNINDRVELTNGAFEMLVGDGYGSISPPAQPTYLFVVDVTPASIKATLNQFNFEYKAGVAQTALASISSAIKDGLLSGQPTARFGIVCLDNKLHLVKFSRHTSRPEIITMSGNFETCPIPASYIMSSLDELQSEETLAAIPRLWEAFTSDHHDGSQTSIPVKSVMLLCNIILKGVGGKVCIILANSEQDWGVTLQVDPNTAGRNLHDPPLTRIELTPRL